MCTQLMEVSSVHTEDRGVMCVQWMEGTCVYAEDRGIMCVCSGYRDHVCM